jgi:ParB-like chromosome segregation protein Spo0J
MKINPALEHLVVDISELREDELNARRHDGRSYDSIMSSLAEFGQQKPIVVLDNGTVVAGNGTLEAARRLGWTRLAVVRFADEKKARAYAIADNRTSEMSSWDGEALADALYAIRENGVDLTTVGFSDTDLDRLLAEPQSAVDDPSSEWRGMPEFDQQDKTAARQIVMNFRSDDDAQKFGELIGQNVTDKTRSLWYPKAEIERLMDKRYGAK